MISLQIIFRSYQYSAVYYVAGYTYTGYNWHLPTTNILPLYDAILPIKLYTNSNKTEHYIVIGEVDTINSYPQIDIVAAGCGFNDITKLRDLITIERVDDISNLTLNLQNIDKKILTTKNFEYSNGIFDIYL